MVIFLRSFSKARLHFGPQSTIYAAVVELVDTRDSKSREGNLMSVRARPAVPGIMLMWLRVLFEPSNAQCMVVEAIGHDVNFPVNNPSSLLDTTHSLLKTIHSQIHSGKPSINFEFKLFKSITKFLKSQYVFSLECMNCSKNCLQCDWLVGFCHCFAPFLVLHQP